MSGAMYQMAARGQQDDILTGKPDVTFFMARHKQHTPFAIEIIEQTFNGTVGWGNKVSCNVSRNGDLLSRMYVGLTLTQNGNTWYPAEAAINLVELEIGGARIDKHPQDWFRIYDEVFRSSEEKDAYRRMTCFSSEEQTTATDNTPDPPLVVSSRKRRFQLPLLFFMNQNVGSALPICALQFHDIKITITFAKASEIVGIDTTAGLDATLMAEYIIIGDSERAMYQGSKQTMLITQVQTLGDETFNGLSTTTRRPCNPRMNINHPVRFLAWFVRGTQHGIYNHARTHVTGSTATPEGSDYNDAYAPLYTGKLVLNGTDRQREQSGKYYNQWVTSGFKARPRAGIYIYPFAITPNSVPSEVSGHINFSRIDNPVLNLFMKQVKPGAKTAALLDDDEFVTEPVDTVLDTVKIMAYNTNVMDIADNVAVVAFAG